MFRVDNILFLPALTSIVFLIAGCITYVFPPKKINFLYGYRTNSSMKSQERWDFAQKYSSVQMIKMAVVMFVVSLVFSFFTISENLNLILGTIVLLIVVGFMFYKIETAIKIKFSKE